MQDLFFTVLNMSMTAGAACIIIMLVRGSIGRILPQTFSYALWGIVLYRMIVPFSFPSIFSVLGNMKRSMDSYTSAIKAVSMKETFGFETFSGHKVQELSTLYPAGAELPDGSAGSIFDEENRELMKHVLLHEFCHIKRWDHLIKPLFFVALCIHWFNPVLWIAFKLFDKDMEMSCDEGVVKVLKPERKEDYAASLLNMASEIRVSPKSSLAFQATNVGERVKHIVKYKKPRLAVAALALALLLICAVCLLSNSINLGPGMADGKENVIVLCSAEDTDIADTILLLGFNSDRKGYQEGDLKRIEVQQAFLEAALEQKSDMKISAAEVYRLLSGGMETDLDMNTARTLISILLFHNFRSQLFKKLSCLPHLIGQLDHSLFFLG